MKIFNSLTNNLQELKPLNDGKVTIYVCGITPYDTTHLGHAFTYISFDVLIRYLKFKGFEVIYTQNVTDINDRDKDILERAIEQNTTWQNLSAFWTKRFLTDMTTLNWIKPTYLVKASQNLAAMIDLIKKLLKKNLAYQINGSVYLSICKFPNYGKLSGLSRKQMISIAKDFEEDLDNKDKIDPLDVTLWRASTPNQSSHIPSFDSPWGPGRPGWHIECSTMAISSLGDQIDIHGGGKDLIFPHHEAEIAQSEGATGKVPFAKYWLHVGTVYFRGEKMSKSRGNLVMISSLLKKYSPNTIRWLLLSNHWQKDWEFKEKDLKKARENVTIIKQATRHPQQNSGPVLKEFIKIMNQDLNTPKALKFLLKNPNKEIYAALGFK